MDAAVERAISVMWDRYHEPLTLNELADAAILSRFHFCRVFRTATGTSPGRFLAAIRIHKAKHLLLQTDRSVTDISYRVGYHSLGTFVTRFVSGVGMSPTRYREFAREGIVSLPAQSQPSAANSGTIQGSLRLPATRVPVRVYVAVFESPVPQGRPMSCTVVDAADSYQLCRVPEGEWFVQAAAAAVRDVDPRPWCRTPVFIDRHPPVRINPGDVCRADLNLRPTTPADLPILLALPELDSHWLPRHAPLLIPQ